MIRLTIAGIIRGTALDWVKNYFLDRKQFVQYNETSFSTQNIVCDVHLGSMILGPLFFLLYIRDISSPSNILKFILFANDTNVFVSHKNAHELFNTINSEMSKVSTWFKANRFSLNTKKTNLMIFKSRQKPNYEIDSPPIDRFGEL